MQQNRQRFEAENFLRLGAQQIEDGQFQGAFSILHSVLHLYLQLADRRGEAEATLKIGICCHHMNFPQEANTCYRTALHIAHLLNDPALAASFRQTIAPPSQPHDL